MGALKDSKISSDRQKWQKVFDALVHMLQTQQTQIESLAKERKLLEDRIKMQYDRWVSDVNLFQDAICQMKRDFTVQEMLRNVDAAKSDLMLGLKHRDAFISKIKLDDAVGELADFREWFDYLSRKCCETKGDSSEMLALLSERNFVWNQYKKRESDLTDQLKSKSTEVEQANDKLQKLLTRMERLQSSNTEKDSTIQKLETNLVELEVASAKKSEEISVLTRELELVRKDRSRPVAPVLRRCSAEPRLGEKNRVTDARNTTPKKDSPASQVLEKGCRSSKRKAVDGVPISEVSEAPKLFTSTFKIPKLKGSSPCVI